MKIYLDMDGVLCNFLKAAGGLIGKDLENHCDWEAVRDEAWLAVHAQGWSFWRDLEWMPEGRELFTGILDFGIPTILSAHSSRPEIKSDSIVGKKIWLARELDRYFAETAHFVLAVGKQTYAASGSVLIDDATRNIEQWIARGGIGILHEGDAAKTLAKLNFLSEKNNG